MISISLADSYPKMIHEVLDEARRKRSKAEVVAVLQANETWALKDILRGSMDSTVEFALPPGDPPYTPGEDYSAPKNLIKEHKRFVYFVKGTHLNKYMSKNNVSFSWAFKEFIWPRRKIVFLGLFLIIIRSLSGLVLPYC